MKSSQPLHPLRSLLFVPATNDRAVKKAQRLHCDGIILDLEDAVLPDKKDQAREAGIDILKAKTFLAPLTFIRVNSVETDFFSHDMKALADIGPQAIVLPKVNSAVDVEAAAKLLDADPAAAETQLWIMIETAMGVMHVREICAASPRLAGLIIGPNDLLKDLRAPDTSGSEALLTSYGLCVLAARAYDLVCIDGVYKQYKDTEGFRKSCVQGRRLGFDGKSLIHPAQIDPANDIFGPSVAEIDHANRQIAAFEAAQKSGQGVGVLDGEIVEYLHVEQAKRLLAVAKSIAKRQEV